jgi:hypothetical protein
MVLGRFSGVAGVAMLLEVMTQRAGVRLETRLTTMDFFPHDLVIVLNAPPIKHLRHGLTRNLRVAYGAFG